MDAIRAVVNQYNSDAVHEAFRHGILSSGAVVVDSSVPNKTVGKKATYTFGIVACGPSTTSPCHGGLSPFAKPQ